MRAVQGKGPSAQGIAEGLWLFSLGIWKKVIVAEAFGGGADWGWANLPASTAPRLGGDAELHVAALL